MSLVFGHANPALQTVLLELCFSDKADKPAFRQPRFKKLDQALIDDVLSAEQLRVLPLLYRSVPMEVMSTASINKVVGMYKHTFCRNHLMLHRLGQVQAVFDRAGFAPMIGLKGLPSIAYVNEGLGARPMTDVDVLIPNLHLRPVQALTILNSLGYQIKSSDFRSVTMLSPENLEIDTHWYVHDWALGQDLVDIIVKHAVPQTFASQTFLVPCVEHHLAHIIAHGVLTKTLTYDARWVFDTVAVLKRTERMDIDRFAECANRVAAPQRIRDALLALANELPDSITLDRTQLRCLHDAVNTNSKIVSWLYEQTPTPNLPPEQLRGTPRMDRIKGMLIAWFWMPRYLRKREGLSFFSYWRWIDKFPPVSHRQAAWNCVKKLLLRGPKFLYQVVAQK